ncbi:MAG: aldo/keto reductase [Anaeroplasma sp.]|nr:aldo/keto reductase [Anaeroplasma sp.]
MIKEEFFVLSNGVKIPKVGFGTWQSKSGEEAYNAVLWALEAGYRHIDTAYAYENEESVANAIIDSKIKREDLFITTKLPSHIKTYEGCIQYFNESINNLKLDYIDLYLIHAPWPWSNIGQDCTEGNIEVWKAMIDLYNQKKIRAIGVSNFHVQDIKALVEATGVWPMVNQIRYFIGNRQDEITDFCQANNILVQAYSPMATSELLNNSKIIEIAEKYNKSVAKICIRYCLQKNTNPLPKSVHKERIIDNIDLDFEISKEDMDYLDSLHHIVSTRKLRD